MAVVVPIESRQDQRKRQTLPVIAHRLRIDASFTAELDRQLSQSASTKSNGSTQGGSSQGNSQSGKSQGANN